MAKQKKTEIVAKDPKHRRFYVYRHKMVGDDQVIENLSNDDTWVQAFENAILIADHDKAVIVAQVRKAVAPERDSDFTYCIGAVDVVVNGFFSLEIIK